MQTWMRWDLDDMQDAAEAEGHVSLDALAVPETRLVASLPYFGAFSDYGVHVAGCAGCRRDDRPDCAEGVTLLEVSHAGLMVQQRMALSN